MRERSAQLVNLFGKLLDLLLGLACALGASTRGSQFIARSRCITLCVVDAGLEARHLVLRIFSCAFRLLAQLGELLMVLLA